MVDSFVLLAPLLLLAVVGLLAFVGCDIVFGLDRPPPNDIKFGQVLLQHTQMTATGVVTAPFGGVITAGDLIVVWIWFHTSSDQTVASVSDSAGNVYQPADQLMAGKAGFATARQQVWFAKNVVSGGASPVTFTVAFSASVDAGIGVCAFEYTSASKTEPLVTVAQASGFGQEASSPGTVVDDAVVVFGAVLFSGSGTNDLLATPRLAVNGNVAEDYFAKPLPLQIKATPVNPAAQDWIAQMVAFR